MRRKRILVTGGAGYIGYLLTHTLLKKGYEVRVIDNLMFGVNPLKYLQDTDNYLEFIEGDIRDRKLIENSLKDIDGIVHLAALVGAPICNKKSEDVFEINFVATRDIVDKAMAIGIERFIFASTYSVYGLAKNDVPLFEESPLNPQSLYAETKALAEEYILANIKERFSPCILRFATAFGVSQRMRFDLIVNKFVADALFKKNITVYQKDFYRSFIHLHDIVRAICLVLETDSNKVKGAIFNVGDERLNFSKIEMVEEILKVIPNVHIECIDYLSDGDMRSLKLVCSKIKTALGYEITKTLRDGIVEIKKAIEEGIFIDPYLPKYYQVK